MGKLWGQIAHVRGIITYGISPYEVGVFNNLFKRVMPNTLRRIKEEFLYIAVPTGSAYMVYRYAEAEHTRLSRKDPADYANEK